MAQCLTSTKTYLILSTETPQILGQLPLILQNLSPNNIPLHNTIHVIFLPNKIENNFRQHLISGLFGIF